MLMNSVAWFIAITITTKSCVISYEFPSLNFKSILPNLNSSLINKPFQTLYQAPLSAVNLLQRANPLNYLVVSTSSSGLENLNAPKTAPHSQNYETTLPDWKTLNKVTKTPNARQNAIITTPLQYVTRKQHEVSITPIPFVKNQVPKHDLVQLSRDVNSAPQITITLPSGGMVQETFQPQNSDATVDHFMQGAEELDRKFYQASFRKLVSISPPERRENGISFALSGLFLYFELLALCTESDAETVKEIKQSLGLKTTCAEQVRLLNGVLSTLPKSSDFLKFRWSSRLVLGPRIRISENFLGHTAPALQVHLDHLDKIGAPEELSKRLNQMVETDSGGAMHDTFEEEELSNGICAAWLTTIYLRARWRSAPTALNGSWLFHDGDAPPRTMRMIRINDVMRYVQLDEWDAEAIEIRYAAPDLTLLILLPRSRSLKKLSARLSEKSLRYVYEKMHTKRVAVILPIYTLRMTLLLPGKLEMMGILRLVDSKAGAGCESLKLSHSVQRIMFWAEAGRNAFKDDGIEWDDAPELERIIDRPYIFFVRWRNLTLLNGNFVL